ncbi:MAG: TerB family tellurite resistance protein [Myxococcota bacterium]|jgi:tellurite resistance protein|nr:TerB family tellurite resistance protein [Myxococcota bacterium]
MTAVATQGSVDKLGEQLVEVMALMVLASGELSDQHVEQILACTLEHRAFAGMSDERLRTLFSRSLQRVQEIGLTKMFAEIRTALQDYADRLLAFAMATRICFADDILMDDELALLRTFQIEFGLRDAHVAQIVDAMQRQENMDELIGVLLEQVQRQRLSREEALIEVMLLMAAADGEVQPEEATQLAMTIASQEDFRDFGERQIDDAVRNALTRIQSDGIANRLSVLSRVLTDAPTRLKAMTYAYSILLADGILASPEGRCLRQMAKAFELDEQAMRQVLSGRV